MIYGQGYMGKRGGPYEVGKGLQDLFGKERVRDAPISELTLVGAGVGAAMTGLRTIVELEFVDLTPLAADQIVNQAAKERYMFGGQYRVPFTLRRQQARSEVVGLTTRSRSRLGTCTFRA